MMTNDIRSIIEQEADAVRNIPISERYAEAVDLIVKHVHKQGGTLITAGMGKAGQIAMNMATTFSSTGTPAFFLHPGEAQHGDLGIVRRNDLLLLVSNSGKTLELIELVDLARGLVPDIPFILITSDPQSELARRATLCLPTGAPREVCTLGLTPTTSTTVMTVIGDVLVVGTMDRIGFTTTDMHEAHLNQQMMKAAQKTIVLADASKFGRRGFAKISNMEDVDVIITDAHIKAMDKLRIEEMGIELVIVGEPTLR